MPTVSAGSWTTTDSPVAASKARSAASSGPAGMSNRSCSAGRVAAGGVATCAAAGSAPSAAVTTSALRVNSRAAPRLRGRRSGTSGRRLMTNATFLTL